MKSHSHPESVSIEEASYTNMSNICATCSERGNFKSFNATYSHDENREMYSHMLYYCFAIQITEFALNSNREYGICDECISKLRSATVFRKQIENAQSNYKVFSVFENKSTLTEINVNHKLKMTDEIYSLELDKMKSAYIHSQDIQVQNLFTNNFRCNEDNLETKITVNDNELVDNLEIKLNGENIESFRSILSCGICTYSTLSQYNYNRHIKSHEKVKNFLCEGCGYLCATAEKLRLHSMMHNGARPYKCKQCSYASRSRGDLTQHSRIHTDVRPHTCNDCGFSFRRVQHLKAHRVSHESAKFKCRRCEFVTKSYHSIQRHNWNHTKKYKCANCSQTFDQVLNYRNHKSSVHKIIYNNSISNLSNIEDYRCDVCNGSFKTRAKLKGHMISHSERRPFVCENCNSTFKRKGDLRQHLVKHSKDKKYTCDLCPFKSARKGDLHDHLRSHSDIRPFCCDICPMKFKRANHLKLHLMRHMKDKSFSHICNICEFSCKHSVDLKSHMSIHSSVSVQSASSTCDYSCKQNRQLKKHTQDDPVLISL